MISICIIVKNDEVNLNKCLQNLKPFNYEIVVVDTGSTDNTKEIALQYTEKVYDFEWCDDFSSARNFALSKATNEYIIMIDSDEFIKKIDKNKLENLLLQYPKDVGRIHCNNVFERNDLGFISNELINRIFSKNYYHYTGKIHEQITAINGKDYSTYLAPLYMDHIGYGGDIETRNKKSERNIKMLLHALKENGDDPYVIYQLGKSYYMKEDYHIAADYFGKALEFDLDTNLEYVIDLVDMYGYALINSNQLEKALFFENIYDVFSGSADFVFLMGLIYMQNAMFDKAVHEFLKATEFNECKVQGVNSYLAYYNVGVIHECLGDKKQALVFYKKCGNYEKAKQGIKRCGSL